MWSRSAANTVLAHALGFPVKPPMGLVPQSGCFPHCAGHRFKFGLVPMNANVRLWVGISVGELESDTLGSGCMVGLIFMAPLPPMLTNFGVMPRGWPSRCIATAVLGCAGRCWSM